MRKLTRTSQPEVLQKFDHVQHTWDHVSPSDKASIRAALDEFQHGRCAYCDGWRSGSHHIEHFRRKRGEPRRTFEWANLFVSCGPGGNSPHCGGFKDRQTYDANLLIKPDEDDPQEYLHFLLNGVVIVRDKISDAAKQRAECTMTVFNLNHSVLIGKRKREAEKLLEMLRDGYDDPGLRDIVLDDIKDEIARDGIRKPYLAIWLDALRDA